MSHQADVIESDAVRGPPSPTYSSDDAFDKKNINDETTVPDLSRNKSSNAGDVNDLAVADRYTGPDEHVLDPKLEKKTKWSDLFSVLAAGCALLSDGYQNNAMTMVNVLFGKRYGSKVYTSVWSTRVSNALLVGAILGQISIGLVCDRIGRKSAIILATLLLFLGSVLTAAAVPYGHDVHHLFWWMCVTRGMTGVGLGGEYPTASVSCSEAASERYGQKKRSSIFILCTNVVLSIGGPFAISVFLIVLSASGYSNTTSASDMNKLDIVWRVVFAIGSIWPLSVFYFRIRMMNSKLYRKGAIKNKVPYGLFLRKYWRRLIGTAGVWFLYDIVTFPNGIFSGEIISSILTNPTIKKTGEYNLLLGAIAFPGAVIGAFTVGKLGSRNQMMMGFAGYIVLGCIIGGTWEHLIKTPVAFVILYGLFTSIGNFGPGSMCGLTASDSYPSALRGTAYGISAALGKTGAAVGTQIFTPIQTGLGKRYTFFFSAGFGLIGILIAWACLVDTSKLDLAEEDRKWLEYLHANGWEGVVGAPEKGLLSEISFAGTTMTAGQEMREAGEGEQRLPEDEEEEQSHQK